MSILIEHSYSIILLQASSSSVSMIGISIIWIWWYFSVSKSLMFSGFVEADGCKDYIACLF